MNAVTLASRAVLAQYATKVIRPFEYIILVLFLVLIVATILLASYISPWWWLLMIIVIAYGVVGSVAWLVIHFTIDKIRPEQTPPQTEAVNKFIIQIEKVADTLQISRFGLVLRIVRDVMSRGRANVLTEFANDSKDLKQGFEEVIRAFR